MEKNIDYEFKERSAVAYTLSMYVILACFIWPVLIFCILNSDSGEIIYFIFIIVEILLLGAAIFLRSVRSIVNADKSKLTVKNFALGNLVSTQSFDYDSIEAADCFVKKYAYKGKTRYSMEAVIRLEDGKKLKFTKDLKIRVNLHRRNPEQYNQLIASEPMLQLCRFVNTNKARK